jgi:hypothetical protein
MFKHPLLLTFAFCSIVLTGTLRAANLNEFPAETKWMLNLDMRAAQTSPMLNFVVEKMAPVKRQQAQTKLAAIKAMFGIDLIKDIDQLIIAGNGKAEQGGVAYVYGTFDAQRLSTILAASKGFASVQHGKFEVMGWNDNGQKYLSFAKPNLALLSNSQTVLFEALDVFAGKTPGLDAGSVFKTSVARSGQDVLTLQAIDLPAIVGEQPKAQALKQAQALRLVIHASQPEELDAELAVTAASDDTAVQIRQALMGIQALAMLRAAEAPEGATLASLAKISGEGRNVNVTMALPKSAVETAMRQREARQAAKAAARAAEKAAAGTTAAPAAGN